MEGRMKPILFNTEMVRAILDGRKTVTRRVVKPPVPMPCELRLMTAGHHTGEWHLYCEEPMLDKVMDRPWGAQYFPPFQIGDVLYVRETWSPMFPNHTSNVVVGYMYKADDFSVEEYDKRYPNGKDWEWLGKWKPSIHMPKEAARIFLRVTNVRAERLQDRGNGWCLSIEHEGVRTPQDPILYVNDEVYHEALRGEMRRIWDSTIKKSDLDLYGWDANPYVWVIEFERCEKPEGE